MPSRTMIPLGDPFTLVFEPTVFGMWYRKDTKSPWHQYSHSQFYMQFHQQKNYNHTEGSQYLNLYLVKRHIFICPPHAESSVRLDDAGEFKSLGYALLKKDFGGLHICKSCGGILKKRLIETGFAKRHANEMREKMRKRWDTKERQLGEIPWYDK